MTGCVWKWILGSFILRHVYVYVYVYACEIKLIFSSHIIHVWYIYLHEWLIFMGNVGKYTIHGFYGHGKKIHHVPGTNGKWLDSNDIAGNSLRKKKTKNNQNIYLPIMGSHLTHWHVFRISPSCLLSITHDFIHVQQVTAPRTRCLKTRSPWPSETSMPSMGRQWIWRISYFS